MLLVGSQRGGTKKKKKGHLKSACSSPH